MSTRPPEPPSDGSAPSSGGSAAQNDAMDRLRAADPAGEAEPETVALRAAIDSRLADGSGSEKVAAGDELGAARARRRAAWPARMAGAAAAALVVGAGGGYAIGAAGDEPPPPAAGAISLQDGPGTQGAPADGFTMEGGAPTQGSASDGAADAARLSLPAFGGRTVFTASGLSDAGGAAVAWSLDPAQVFTEQTVATAAQVLGVEGEPRSADGHWSVGAQDGSGPHLTLSPDGTGGLSFYDPGADPWSCAPSQDVAPGLEEGADAPTLEEMEADPSLDAMAPGECREVDLGPAPDGDAATGELRDVLDDLGLDAESFEYVVESWGDTAWTYVTAYQVIDGQRSGITWNASFSGAGLQSLSGALAPAVELGEYDVVSPAEAVERLGDPRFGSGAGGPIAFADGAEPGAGDMATSSMRSEPELPAAVAPGSSFSWPVTEVTIVDARLGVALHTQPDGAAVLLPSYELVSDTGGIWSVVAVADDHLDFGAVR